MTDAFEEYLAYIEITLGFRLFDWQKEMLRNFYDGKDWLYMPLMYKGREITFRALELLEELMYKENQNEKA